MGTVTCAISLTVALLLSSVVAQEQSSARDKAFSSISSVDFLNFTYKPKCISGTVTTQTGKYDNPHNTQEDVPVYFAINDVIYGDFRADGDEEAIVVTGCNLGGTGYWTEAFLFELRTGKPVEVDRIGGGDRAMGGIKSIRVEGHFLKVSRQYGMALCCADYIEITTYALRDNRLVPVGSPERVAAASGKPIRALRFKRGSSSGTIAGTTGADAIYEFRAFAGQALMIEPARDMKTTVDVNFGVMDPDGMTMKQERDDKVRTIKLPSDGVYTLVVSSNESNVPYEFNVSIR